MSDLMAAMQDLDPASYLSSPEYAPLKQAENRLLDKKPSLPVPQCSCCEKPLLIDMRASCKLCGAIVCQKDNRCHQQHNQIHLRAQLDKNIRDMSLRGLSSRERRAIRKGKKVTP